jgi:RimJ/RimL family protein N-acetyltransferase
MNGPEAAGGVTSGQPTIRTARLVLRPLVAADAADVERLAGDREIARGTLTIPHPYPRGAAAAWIAEHAGQFERREQVTFAVTDADGLVGVVGMRLELDHQRAELGYWTGVPYWGRGYATESALAVIRFGFDTLGLNRIYARHFTRNPVSGRVMQKAGMRFEGIERQHVLKDGRFEDLACYAILRGERP